MLGLLGSLAADAFAWYGRSTSMWRRNGEMVIKHSVGGQNREGLRSGDAAKRPRRSGFLD